VRCRSVGQQTGRNILHRWRIERLTDTDLERTNTGSIARNGEAGLVALDHAVQATTIERMTAILHGAQHGGNFDPATAVPWKAVLGWIGAQETTQEFDYIHGP
jgi:hypothetical protein